MPTKRSEHMVYTPSWVGSGELRRLEHLIGRRTAALLPKVDKRRWAACEECRALVPLLAAVYLKTQQTAGNEGDATLSAMPSFDSIGALFREKALTKGPISTTLKYQGAGITERAETGNCDDVTEGLEDWGSAQSERCILPGP